MTCHGRCNNRGTKADVYWLGAEAAKPPSNVASKVAPSATAKVPVQSSQVKRGMQNSSVSFALVLPAAPVTSPALLTQYVRAGGYGDAGGLTASGELPEAEPIQVNSEGELKLKFAQLGRDLDLKNEWDQRIQVGFGMGQRS